MPISCMVATFREHKRLSQELAENQELAQDSDPEMRELAQAEVKSIKDTLVKLEEHLKFLLLPADPMMAPPRDLPMASSSSIKMMQGAFSRAWVKSSRTRDAPTPTNISTNSEPEMEKKGTCASPATARASSVLPVPGGPIKRTPLGIWPPRRWNRSGVFR